MEPFAIRIPATTANLGPGYGLVGLALDVGYDYSVTPSDDHELRVERIDDASDRVLDLRHDAVVRGMRAAAERIEVAEPGGITISVRSEVPRGAGLGSNTADFAAGMRIALTLAESELDADELLGILVELGGDPAHGGAALTGGLTVAIPLHSPNEEPRFRILRYPLDDAWRFVIAAPDQRIGTADVHRIVPANLPNVVVCRTAGRLCGLLHALAAGDTSFLRSCLVDEVHVPYRTGLTPGMAEAMDAARDAGAAGVTISGHGPAVIALTTEPERAEELATAMRDAFDAEGTSARTFVCAPEGG